MLECVSRVNNFKHKKIRIGGHKKALSEKAKQHLITAFGIVLLILVVYWSGLQIMEKLSGTRLLNLFSGVFGRDLQVDSSGHTNILMLGVGGEGHEGKDLTDTMIVASIDQADGSVGMISIPRDLYVDSSLGESRVNRLYEKGKLKWDSEQGLDFMRSTIEKTLAISIPYYVKVDFEAFEQIVDSIDGIDIYVEETINDPLYPKDGTFDYELFFIEKGLQHLDGKTALKYARSRKTSSDFDRSKRQQQVIVAMKNKAKEANILTRSSMLKSIYSSVRDHVETNLSIGELISLGGFAAQWDSKKMSTATLNDEPSFRGGFLYPPLRELYGGAYVLLPAGDNFSSLRSFVNLVLYGPQNLADTPLSIFNTTEESGLAAITKGIFNRFGIYTVGTGNSKSSNPNITTWYFSDPGAEPLIRFLQTLVPGKVVNQIPEQYKQNPRSLSSKIILELGLDSVRTLDKLDIFKNVVLLKLPEGVGTSTKK